MPMEFRGETSERRICSSAEEPYRFN